MVRFIRASVSAGGKPPAVLIPDYCRRLSKTRAALPAGRSLVAFRLICATSRESRARSVMISSIDGFIRTALGQRHAGRGHNPGHAHDLLILLIAERRDDEADVLEELHLAQGAVGAQLGERHMPRQALYGAQVRHQTLPIRVEWIGIGVASDFGERVEGALRRAVIAEHAIAAAHLLELPQRVGPLAGAAPHLLAFDEKRIPVVVVRVHTEEPVTALGCWTSHGQRCRAALYTGETCKGKICWPIVLGRSQAGRTPRAGAQSWGTSDRGRLEAVEVCNLMIKRILWD